MILMKDIVREGHKVLKQVAKPVALPFSKADEKILMEMLGYLANSQNEEIATKYKLRPGVGLAAPQINVSKRMLVILAKIDADFYVLPMVNPEILSHSEDYIYLPDGEGCLSVNRETKGITPRYREVKVKANVFDLKTGQLEERTMNFSGYISIVFQHEFDHLEGILFVDKLYKEYPNATPLVSEENEEK